MALASVVADPLGSIGKFYLYGTEPPSAAGNDMGSSPAVYVTRNLGWTYAPISDTISRVVEDL